MHTRRGFLLQALRGVDIALLLIACGLASWIPYDQTGRGLTFPEFLRLRVEVSNFVIFAGWLAVWQLSFQQFGLYRSRRLAPIGTEPALIAGATLLGTLSLAVAAVMFSISIATPRFLVAVWLISTVLTIAVRLGLRYTLYMSRLRGRKLRCLLIAGTNDRAFEFARRVHDHPELGYRVIGLVDEPRALPEDFGTLGYRLVTDFEGFQAYLRAHVVDEVVVCLPVKSQYEAAAGIIEICREQGVMVRFLSDVFNNPDLSQDIPVITSSAGLEPSAATGVKRALDVFVSLFMLTLLAPLAAVIIVAIKLTSSGPTHFGQERLGLNKHRFRMLKFRTMGVNAEAQQAALEELNEAEGPVFKIKNDPRVTSIGRVLRKTSLDELPQLFNVLKGDMSLVGPRPLPVKDYEGFDEDWHRRRFSVRPGMTCLWQVGGRSDVSFSRWMELDMEYIDNWSLGLDLRILARTIPAVLRGSGAS